MGYLDLALTGQAIFGQNNVDNSPHMEQRVFSSAFLPIIYSRQSTNPYL